MAKREKLKAIIIEPNMNFPLLSTRREITIHGRRNGEALRHLVEAGQKGISSLDHPGLRLSHYILCLRRAGLDIETVAVRCGDFTYGRYILKSDIRIEDADRVAA